MLLDRDELARPDTFVRRVCGVFVAPVRTFASFQIAPRWFDALALSVVIVSASTYMFSSSDRGARLLVERRVVFAEAAGRHFSTDQVDMMIAREQRGARLAAVLAGAWLVTLTLVTASGALAIVRVVGAISGPLAPPFHDRHGAPGGRFTRALSIAAHAALILAVATPCRLVLDLWRGAAVPATSIGVFLPFLPRDTIWAHLGNTIDLFGLWWAHTLAIGFAVVYLRRPGGLRFLLIGLYLVMATVQAAARVFLGVPSF